MIRSREVVSELKLRKCLLEFLRWHDSFPVAGKNAWSIGTAALNSCKVVPNLAIVMYINEELQIFGAMCLENKVSKPLRAEEMLIFEISVWRTE